jgi:DNA modification methylase
MIEYTTKFIDPKKILLPSFEYDKASIVELANFIKVSGLQNKPIVRQDMTIIAGKRRVLACIHANIDEIEIKVANETITETEACLISLHENLGRNNLQWYDCVCLQRQLHDLRQDEHGKSKSGSKVGWSLRDTAEELGISLGALSENLRIADEVLRNPSLRKIQDKETAKRIILTDRKRVAAEMNTALPSLIQTNQVFHGSSEEILLLFPDKVFDVCITDPPWLEYVDKDLTKDEFTESVFTQVYRKLKNDSFLYMFVSTDDFYIYRKNLEKIGFSVQKFPLIWIKEGVLSLGGRSWQYQRNYEPILVAVKGAPALTRDILSSVYSTPGVSSSARIHPNEKPTSIIKILLENSSYEKSVVLDPFGGSGVVAEACIQTGRSYVTIERDAKYYAGIVDRLKEAKNG